MLCYLCGVVGVGWIMSVFVVKVVVERIRIRDFEGLYSKVEACQWENEIECVILIREKKSRKNSRISKKLIFFFEFNIYLFI